MTSTRSASRRHQALLCAGVLGVALSPAALGATPAALGAPASSSLGIDVRAGAASAHETIRCPQGPAALCHHPDSARTLRLLATPPCLGAGADEYGGAAVLTVRGTIEGHRIRMVLRRTNSCRIARWGALEALFGGPLRLHGAP